MGLFLFPNYLGPSQDAAVHTSAAALTKFNGVNWKVRTEWNWNASQQTFHSGRLRQKSEPQSLIKSPNDDKKHKIND